MEGYFIEARPRIHLSLHPRNSIRKYVRASADAVFRSDWMHAADLIAKYQFDNVANCFNRLRVLAMEYKRKLNTMTLAIHAVIRLQV